MSSSASKFVILVISGLSGERPAKKLRERNLLKIAPINVEAVLERANPESSEAAALEQLVRLTSAYPSVVIQHWDVSKRELIKDALMGVRPDQTVLFKRAFAEGIGSFGGDPVALVVVDFCLEPSKDDLEVVRALDFLGNAAGAPVLIGAAESPDAMADPIRALRLEGVGNWVFQLTPRWRATATGKRESWINPGYLVAAIAAATFRTGDFAEAAESLLPEWCEGTARKFASAMGVACWDVVFEKQPDEVAPEELWRARANFLSDWILKEPGSFMRVRPIARGRTGAMDLQVQQETLSGRVRQSLGSLSHLLLSGYLHHCVQEWARAARRSDSGIELAGAIREGLQANCPRNAAGEELVTLRSVSAQSGKLLAGVWWHRDAGGFAEQIEIRIPGIERRPGDFFLDATSMEAKPEVRPKEEAEFTRMFQAPGVEPPQPPESRLRPEAPEPQHKAGEVTQTFGSSNPAEAPAESPGSTGVFKPPPPPPESQAGPSEFTRMMQAPGQPSATGRPIPHPRVTSAAPRRSSVAVADGSETCERALDLAVAATVPVGKPVELIALLRLPGSRGLGERLEADRDSELRKPDVRERNFGLDFLRDRMGRLQPMGVTMRVLAPDFDPPVLEKLVRVHPDRDCERQSFLLRPKTTGVLRIQFDLLAGPLTLSSQVLRTRAEEAGQPAQAGVPAIVTEQFAVAVKPRPWWRRLAAPAAVAAVAALLMAGVWAWRGQTQLHNSRGVETPVAPLNPKAHGTEDGKSYALLIATDQYEYLSSLRNPVRDADAMEQELKSHYGFITRHVYDVTRDQMLAAIKSYHQGRYGPADQLLIYIAGHGTFDDTEQRGFLMAKDSRADDQLHTSQLSHDDLRAVVDTLPVEHIFIVIDACFGGSFDPKIGEAMHRGSEYGQISLDELRKRKLDLRTRQFLTSGSKEFVSDGRGEHSPFAQILLEALRDYGGDQKYLTIARLRPYFEKTQSEARQGEFGRDQAGSEFFFVPLH